MDLKKLSKVADSTVIPEDILIQVAELNNIPVSEIVEEWLVDEYTLQERWESETEGEEEFDDWFDQSVTTQDGGTGNIFLDVYQFDNTPDSLNGVHYLDLTESQLEKAGYHSN